MVSPVSHKTCTACSDYSKKAIAVTKSKGRKVLESAQALAKKVVEVTRKSFRTLAALAVGSCLGALGFAFVHVIQRPYGYSISNSDLAFAAIFGAVVVGGGMAIDAWKGRKREFI